MCYCISRQPTPEEIQAAIDTWDDRVRLSQGNNFYFDTNESIRAFDGYKFRLSEDCLKVEMVKDTKCGFCVKPKN